jgi:hypothetical protein
VNQREALRFAAWEVLQDIESHAEEYRCGDRTLPEEDFTEKDRERVAKAYEDLVRRLNFIATGRRT